MNTRYLRLLNTQVTGVEVSDTTLRLITLTQHADMVIPERYGEFAIPAGCLDNGRIVNKSAFISFLKTVKKLHKVDRINLVLASSQIQTMSLSIKGAAPMYIKEAVEKEFALSAKDILYDYHAIGGDSTVTTFQVTAVPRVVSQEFIACFKSVGITVASLESVGHALSRALLPAAAHSTAMVVAIDTEVTTITMVVNGKTSYTVMFAFGDAAFTDIISQTLSIDSKEVQKVKREQGLIIGDDRRLFDALVDDCVALVRHINHTYIEWRTAHKSLAALEAVYLTGAGSVLRGLDEYLAVGLRVPVIQANVWVNCLSFDEHIPVVPQNDAVRYAASIGAALTSGDTINLVPLSHKKSLQRKHIMSVTAKIILSFLLGVGVGFAVARIIAIPTVHMQVFGLLHKIEAQW